MNINKKLVLEKIQKKQWNDQITINFYINVIINIHDLLVNPLSPRVLNC